MYREALQTHKHGKNGVFAVLMCALFLISFFLLGAKETHAQEVWNATDWTLYDTITIDATKINSDLTDFPVYVDLADLSSQFWATTPTGSTTVATDIRVTTDGGSPTELPRELVFASSTAQTGELHFKANSLSSTTDTTFRIYYNGTTTGDYATSSTYGAQNVWGNNFAAVWHLQETPDGSAGDILDSTGNGYHGTSTNGMSSASIISSPVGNGYTLSGASSHYIYVGNKTGLNFGSNEEFTLSTWLKSGTTGSDQFVFEKRNSAGYQLRFTTGGGFFQRIDEGASNRQVSAPGTVMDDTWRYIASGRNTAESFIYNNAASSTLSDTSLADLTDSIPLSLGASNAGDDTWDGELDEMRIASTSRSAAWLNAEYYNQSTTTDFYTAAAFIDSEDVTITGFLYENDGATPISTGVTVTAAIGTSTVSLHSAVTGVSGDFIISGIATSSLSSTTPITIFVDGDSNKATTLTYAPDLATDAPLVTANLHEDTVIIDHATGTQNLTFATTTFYDNSDDADILIALDGTTATVTADLLITSGTELIASSFIHIDGDFTNNGIFNANTGTVIASSTVSQTFSGTMTGTSTFYALEITNSSGFAFGAHASSAATTTIIATTTITFQAGSTYDFENIIWQGSSADEELLLRSSSVGSEWYLQVDGNKTVEFVNVKDSDATLTSGGITAATSSNSGNNTNWFGLVTVVAQEWNATDWTLYDTITIDATNVDDDLTDFPVYVDLADLSSRFWSTTPTGSTTVGTDIRVTTDSGSPTELPRELVFASSTAQTGELHFKANSISSTTDTTFRIYYNGTTVGDYATDATYGAQNVWSNDYVAVHHMDDDPTLGTNVVLDSTANGFHGTATGTMTSADIVAGRVGHATDFDGSGDRYNMGRQYTIDDGTLQMWASVDATSTVSQQLWRKDANGSTNNDMSGFLRRSDDVTNGDKVGFYADDGSVSKTMYGPNAIVENTWNAYTFLWGLQGADKSALYIDGLVASSSDKNPDFAVASDFVIGGVEGNTAESWDGLIDEVRLSSSTRSDAWIKAEYYNQSTTTDFYTVSPNTEWNQTSWTLYDTITIESDNVDDDLTDFPVYVDLSDLSASFWSTTDSSAAYVGTDIRVTTDSGSPTELPRELVFASSTLQTGELHFKANSISSTTDTVFRIYYNGTTTGDYSTSATYGAQNVWSNDYVAVYHLNEDPGVAGVGEILDSTANALNGTDVGTMDSNDTITGRVGTAMNFDGGDDHLTFGNPTLFNLSTGTVSSWAQPDTISSTDNNSIWAKYTNTTEGNFEFQIRQQSDATNGRKLRLFNYAPGEALYSTTLAATSTWMYGAVTFNPTSKDILINGVNENTQSNNNVMDNVNAHFSVAARNPNSTPDSFFSGTVDEVRVASTTRSDAWIKAEYYNQSTTTDFYIVNYTGPPADSITITGTLYENDGATPITVPKTITVAVATSTVSLHSTTTATDGSFSISSIATSTLTAGAWSASTEPTGVQVSGITYGNGRFVIHGSNFGEPLGYSDDGINWTNSSSGAGRVTGVAYGNGLFVAVMSGYASGGPERVAVSEDGINWTLVSAADDNDTWESIAYGNGRFVAVGSSGERAMYSDDGYIWSTTTVTGTPSLYDIAYGNGRFVATAANGAYYSTDGISWSNSTYGDDTNWNTIGYGDGVFMAFAGGFSSTPVATSSDGTSWSLASAPLAAGGGDVVYANGMFVVVRDCGGDTVTDCIMFSSDAGASWATSTLGATAPYSAITYGHGRFVVANSDYTDSLLLYTDAGFGQDTPITIFVDENATTSTSTATTLTSGVDNNSGTTTITADLWADTVRLQKTNGSQTIYFDDRAFYDSYDAVLSDADDHDILFTATTSTTTINADLYIDSATTVFAPQNLVIDGDFNNQGTFYAERGEIVAAATSVHASDTAQIFTGNLTSTSSFYDLTQQTDLSLTLGATTTVAGTYTITQSAYASTSAASSTTIFNAGSTFTFNTIDWQGANSSELYRLDSSVPGTAWNLDVENHTVTYVDVQDSDATLTSGGITAYYSTNSGNNTNWTFADLEWNQTSWTLYDTITIESDNVDDDLTDFPVYVDLSDLSASFWTTTDSSAAYVGTDIRVTTDDGSPTELPRELVFASSTAQTGELHFKANSISSTTDTVFRIYYNGTTTGDYATNATYGAENVWSNGYEIVAHFQQDPSSGAGAVLDSTRFNHHGTAWGSMTTSDLVQGGMGNGYDLDGSDDQIEFVDIDYASAPLTFSVWGRISATTSGFERIIDKSDDELNQAFGIGLINNNIEYSIDAYNSFVDVSVPEYGNDVWHYYTGATDSSVLYAYFDALEQATTSHDNTWAETTAPWTVGSRNDGFEWWSGFVDEFRLASSTRSAAWIKAEYYNQSTTTDFYTAAFVVIGTTTVANNDATQVNNAFSFQNKTNEALFAFKLMPDFTNATVTDVTITLSGAKKVYANDFSNIRLYADDDNDAAYDAGDTVVDSGGVMTIDGQSGSITFSTDFAVSGATNYVVVADWNYPENGSQLSLDLEPAGLTVINATGTMAVVGSVDHIRHNRNNAGGGGGAAAVGGAPPAGDGDVGGGGQGGGGNIDTNTGGSTIGNTPDFNWPSADSGSWLSAANTYDDTDGTYATTTTDTAQHEFTSYTHGVPGTDTVQGIEVKLEISGTTAAGNIDVELSWDGGTSWTTAKTTPTLSTTDAVVSLGGASDLWGRGVGAWTPTHFSNANFALRVTGNVSSNEIRIDGIQVKVYHQAGGGGGGGGGGI